MKYFGTDGIRGPSHTGILSPESVLLVGRALGRVFQSEGLSTVVLGRDTRASGPAIEAALARGLGAEGVTAYSAGVITTPGTHTICRLRSFDASIVISASHNPAEDNGIKIMLRDGSKMPPALEAEVERLIDGDWDEASGPPALLTVDNAVDLYVQSLRETAGSLDLAGRTLVLDCANGAASFSAPALFRSLGARVVTLCAEPDGRNINLNCGATHPQTAAARVTVEDAFMGLSLDGDGDRLIALDERGAVVDGDQIMAVLARDRKTRDRLPGDTVVATVMSNAGLDLSLSEIGVSLHRTDVGDRNVSSAMAENGWTLGGEQSGHIIFDDGRGPQPGDGTATALAFLAAVLSSGKTVSQAVSCIPLLPQTLINVPVTEKPPFDRLPKVMEQVHAVEEALHGAGRVLLRYSGTENLARILVEGRDPVGVEAHARSIADAFDSSV